MIPIIYTCTCLPGTEWDESLILTVFAKIQQQMQYTVELLNIISKAVKEGQLVLLAGFPKWRHKKWAKSSQINLKKNPTILNLTEVSIPSCEPWTITSTTVSVSVQFHFHEFHFFVIQWDQFGSLQYWMYKLTDIKTSKPHFHPMVAIYLVSPYIL